MSELKIKLGVDLSAVDDAASQIPEKIERQARRQQRTRIRPFTQGYRVWNESTGRWETQGPATPGGTPQDRRAPVQDAYPIPIGPGLAGMPGGRPFPSAIDSARAYNRPIGPGLAGMPGGIYAQPTPDGQEQRWADGFRDNLLKALEKSALRMVVPVHLINRLTGFIIQGFQHAFQKSREALFASRATGESIDTTQRLGQLGERFGVERGDMYGLLEEAKQKMGRGLFRGGEAIVSLQRLGFTMGEIRSGAVNSVDVLKRLADQYKKTGANAQLAAIGTDIFGNNFAKLVPMLQMGSQEIEDAMDAMFVAEEGTVRVLKELGDVMKSLAELLSAVVLDLIALPFRLISELEDSLRVRRAMGFFEQGETKEGAKKALEELSQIATRGNTGLRGPGESMEAFLKRFEKDYVYREDADLNEDEKAAMAEAIKEFRKTIVPTVANMGSLPMATSLQAMGGGDILSAINRNPVDNIERHTAETAANTAIMAGKAEGSGWTDPWKAAYGYPILTK